MNNTNEKEEVIEEIEVEETGVKGIWRKACGFTKRHTKQIAICAGVIVVSAIGCTMLSGRVHDLVLKTTEYVDADDINEVSEVIETAD